LRLLSNLAKSGAVIPFVMPENDVNEVERIDHATWQTIADQIYGLTVAARAALVNEHSDDDAARIRASILWDDLVDIYRDLRHGLDLYAIGDPEHIAEAVWVWRFGYENHWGAHLFRALATVHEIRYRLFID
jgi:hypothetical protein